MTANFSEIDKLDQQADAVHDVYARRADAILSDRDLNIEAQRRQLDDLTAESRAQLGKLLSARAAKRDSIKTTAMRDLFGYIVAPTGTDLLSRRDADERASRLSGQDDALAALERAELSGDRTLERSVALAALTHGWPQVVARYRTTHPAESDRLDLLDAIERDASSGFYGMRYSLLGRRI